MASRIEREKRTISEAKAGLHSAGLQPFFEAVHVPYVLQVRASRHLYALLMFSIHACVSRHSHAAT